MFGFDQQGNSIYTGLSSPSLEAPQSAMPTGIDWTDILKNIDRLSSGQQRQQGGLQPLQTGVMAPQSTVPIYQLPQMQMGQNQQKKTSADQFAQYAKIFGSIFGFGA